MAQTPLKRVVLIAGPTAAGKSALACTFKGNYTIINGDSQQLYGAFPCLSALPTASQRALTSHRLYGILAYDQPINAAEWALLVKREIQQAIEEERLPVIVGGSGFYLKVLIEGIAAIPLVSQEVQMKGAAILESEGLERLRQDLQTNDPLMYNLLNKQDQSRIMRAWCVFESTGTPLSCYRKNPLEGGIKDMYQILTLALLPERLCLYQRINDRFIKMVEEGAVEEVKAYKRIKNHTTYPPFRTLGVRDIDDYLQGHISLDRAIAQAQQKTRQYAKRQITWMRHQLVKPVVTVQTFGETEEALSSLASLIGPLA